MLEQTEICALNVDLDVLKALESKGITTYDGTIGYLTELEYRYSNTLSCLPNYDFPPNFHEFQVAILDLSNDKRVIYSTDKHQHKDTLTADHAYIVCSRPQNLFDPRPFSLSLFRDNFNENLQHGFLVIVFCSEDKSISYRSNKGKDYEISPYTFTYYTPPLANRKGKKTTIPREEGEIFDFLKKYNDKFTYDLTFVHPDRNVNGTYIPDPAFTPLVLTTDDRIAGIFWRDEKSGVFYFPKLENKEKFLEEFLLEVAPTMFPHLFPDLVKDKWLEEKRYHLPNYDRLIQEKRQIEMDFNLALKTKNEEIKDNHHKYQFLPNMITKHSDDLVKSCIEFLHWLGFENAIDADEVRKKTIKEEDIKIETDRGLIIIEVKGLGGKTTDHDCGQIGKIRARRIEELQRFDIFGHFLVNHERHKPAAVRCNPPFTVEQVNDASYTNRGLMTTWQLFNVFAAVEKGILTKEGVRSSFYRKGYIDFIPEGMIEIGPPNEIIPKPMVIILKLDGTVHLKQSDRLLYKVGDEFKTVTIQSIRLNEKPVDITATGEYGFKLNEMVPKTAVLYAFPPTL